MQGHTEDMPTQQHLPPPVTSTLKSSLFTHEHFSPPPWLPGYMDVMQTVLIIFAMAGFFRTDLDVCVEFKNWVIFCL